MRRTMVAALLVAAAAGMTACGSDDDAGSGSGDNGPSAVESESSEDGGEDAAPPEVEGAGPSDWVFEYEGVTGVIREVSPDDPEVAELEEYRQTVGGPEATYFAVDIDNTEGSGEFGAGTLTVVDADAQQIDIEPAEFYISELQDLPLAADDADVYNAGNDLLNGKYAYDFAVAGAKYTEYLATTDEVSDPTAITYTPYLGSPIEAHSYE